MWEMYKIMNEWKLAKNSIKNPHDLQNGLDIIFSIDSILISNEQTLHELCIFV